MGLGRVVGTIFKNPVVREGLVSGGISTGVTALAGMPLNEALAYGGADALASTASLGLVRKLRPKGVRKVQELGKDGKPTGKMVEEQVRSRLEMPANIAASALSAIPVTALLYGDNPQQGAQGAQQRQVLQQQEQLANVNADPSIFNAYLNDSLVQNTGLPSRSALMEQALNDSQPMINMGAMERDMARIVGLG
jgi:hypothetical protein